MYRYNGWYTVWKAWWVWARTAGVVAAADATDAIDIAWPTEEVSWDFWVVLGFTILPSLWSALENWRKNANEQTGQPLWLWRDLLPKQAKQVPLMLLCAALGVGCATAQTEAMIRQTTDDGFVEEVEFKSSGVVTWGSKQELDADMDYQWGAVEHFRAGGAAGQESADPMTAITAQLLQTLIERAMPVPPPPAPTVPVDLLPPVERGETPDEWLIRVQQIEEVLRRLGIMPVDAE